MLTRPRAWSGPIRTDCGQDPSLELLLWVIHRVSADTAAHTTYCVHDHPTPASSHRAEDLIPGSGKNRHNQERALASMRTHALEEGTHSRPSINESLLLLHGRNGHGNRTVRRIPTSVCFVVSAP